MYSIHLPHTWNEAEVIQFLGQLCNLPDSIPELNLDLQQTEFVEPFGVLLIAETIKTLVAQRKMSGLRTYLTLPPETVHSSVQSYLTFFGFYDYIKGKALPYINSGKGRYVPLTLIQKDDIIDKTHGNENMQQVISQLSEQLAEIIFSRIMEQTMTSYCFREIIRNVFEHAETDSCLIMAQRWERREEAEIVVLDNGIGIYGSLAPTLGISSIDAALSEALRPGVSSKLKIDASEQWANSGFGLYILSQIGQELGEFFLASNGRFVKIQSTTDSPVFGEMPFFGGTVVKLRIELDVAEFFPNLLHRIVEEGEKMAPEGRKASESSKMLS